MIKENFQYYVENQPQLFEQYPNKFLVIKDQQVVGAYNTQSEAYTLATSQFTLGTFLLQHCTQGAESYTQTFHSRVVFEPAF